MHVYFFQKTSKIIAPTKCNVNIAYRIFHYQSPTNYPGKHFTETGVGIGVGTARYGYTTGKFAVAIGSKAASYAAHDEQNNHARPAVENSSTKTTEAPRTNDGSNAKKG